MSSVDTRCSNNLFDFKTATTRKMDIVVRAISDQDVSTVGFVSLSTLRIRSIDVCDALLQHATYAETVLRQRPYLACLLLTYIIM